MPVVPAGAIAIWSGTIASIPAGWIICDGTNGTPDLRERFVKGAAAATEAGDLGGVVQHNHTEQAAGDHTHGTGNSVGTHTHDVSSAGAHQHGAMQTGGYAGTGHTQSTWASAGGHIHTTSINTTDHAHTLQTAGSHTHPISNCTDGRPPFYEVLYIWSTGAALAAGVIIIWSGLLANIPTGWVLCDGSGSTPDLRAKFVKGAPNGVDAGATGGATTHTHAILDCTGHTHVSDSQGDHIHTFAAYAVLHNHGAKQCATSTGTHQKSANNNPASHTHSNTNSVGAHTHDFGSGGIHNHVATDAGSSLPSYYDVAFIYNSSAVVLPVGGILIWTGLLVNIPTGFDLCDGTGRPDLRGKYIRGSAAGINPGGTGGGNTHSHTETTSAGIHNDHTQAVFSGTHQHSATGQTDHLTDNIGAHTHGTWTDLNITGGGTASLDPSAGNHQHSFSLDGWSHTHSCSANAATHDHTVDDANGEPPYYTVQFIYTTTPPVPTILQRNKVGVGL